MLKKKLLLLGVFLSFFIFPVQKVNAQACGTACNITLGKRCLSNATCSSPNGPGICVQTSCTTSNPCCRSTRPTTPPRVPTTPPGGGGGVPVVPTTSGGTPGTVVPGPIKNMTPGMSPLTPYITITPGGGGGGTADCSSPVADGIPDGKVDLADFNLLRKELSGSATTLFCDNDTNGVVDLLDFNIFRIAFIAQK